MVYHLKNILKKIPSHFGVPALLKKELKGKKWTSSFKGWQPEKLKSVILRCCNIAGSCLLSVACLNIQNKANSNILCLHSCSFARYVLLLTFFFSLHCQGGHFSGIYRKVQLKPLKWVKVTKSNGEGEEERPVEALMVLKYGGVLTHAGRKQVQIHQNIKYVSAHFDFDCTLLVLLLLRLIIIFPLQAEELGRFFRNNMYPGYLNGLSLFNIIDYWCKIGRGNMVLKTAAWW